MDRGGKFLPPLKDGDLPYRPEQSFFGGGGGTGEEGAVFTKNAPSSPAIAAIPIPAPDGQGGTIFVCCLA